MGIGFVLPILTISISILFGWSITRLTKITWPQPAKPFFITVLGGIIFTALLYFVCLTIGLFAGIWVAHALALALGIFCVLFYRPMPGIRPWLASLDRYFIITIVLFTILVSLLLYTHMVPTINGDMYTGEAAYGDLPWHLSMLTRIAYGHSFPPSNPHFAGLPIVYPYFANLYSAILVYEGWPVQAALLVPGILFGVCLAALIYDFAFTLTKKPLTSFLSTILFFGTSGIGFFYFLSDNRFSVSAIVHSLLNPRLIPEYSRIHERFIEWASFLTHIIVIERSVLFGIPAGLVIIWLTIFDKDKPLVWPKIVLCAFLLSLMPFLHTHTFLVLIILLPILCLTSLRKGHIRTQLTRYAAVGMLGVVFITPHIPLFFYHIGQNTGFLRFNYWWVKPPEDSVVWFWFKNSYILLPLALCALVIPKVADRSVRIFTACGFLLFAVVNIFAFQPLNWDDIKFLFWVGLFLSVAVSCLFTYLFEQRKVWLTTITLFVFFTMIATTLISLDRALSVRFVLFSKDAISTAQFIQQNTDRNAIFLTYKEHNSPAVLGGRSILMGYGGQMWMLGIPYRDRDQEITTMFEGGPTTQALLLKYHVNYVILEPITPADLIINRQYFAQFPVVFSNPSYTIYKVTQ